MAEGNGSARLTQIEALLANLAERQEKLFTSMYLQENRLSRIEALAETHEERLDRIVTIQEAEQKRLNEISEKTDRRIGEMVSAIGRLIERLPLERS